MLHDIVKTIQFNKANRYRTGTYKVKTSEVLLWKSTQFSDFLDKASSSYR